MTNIITKSGFYEGYFRVKLNYHGTILWTYYFLAKFSKISFIAVANSIFALPLVKTIAATRNPRHLNHRNIINRQVLGSMIFIFLRNRSRSRLRRRR